MDEPTIIEKLEKDPTEMVEIIPKVNNKKTGLAILITILFIAIVLPVAGLAYLIITGNLNYLGEKEIEVEEEIVEAENSIIWVDWEGEYLKARLPEGWSIEEISEWGEYYKGFGGITIRDGNESELIKLITDFGGVGWIVDCSTPFYKFDDYSPELYQLHLDAYENKFVPEGYDVNCPEEMNLYEFINYQEIDFLGGRLNRVEGSYYGDYDMDDEYFTVEFTPDWLEANLAGDIVIDKVRYNKTIEGTWSLEHGAVVLLENDKVELEGGKSIFYSFSLADNLLEDILLSLDQVFESMEIIEHETASASEEFTGEYIGINSDLFDGDKDYYQFREAYVGNSQTTVYVVDVDSVSDLNLSPVEGTTYTVIGVKGDNGGAAAGTAYVEVVDVVSILDSEIYVNETYSYKLEYPTDWTLTYTEGECPSASAPVVGCENPDAYEYVLTINKSDYYFEMVKLKNDNANNSAFVVYPDSEFEENYQDCVGWLTFGDYVDLSTGLEGSFRRNETWYEDVYPGVGGFYVAYRGNELEDDTNLYLLKNDFGSIKYQTPENVDGDILLEMDTILESMSLIE